MEQARNIKRARSPPASSDGAQDECLAYIGNLPFNPPQAQMDELRTQLEKFGEIVALEIRQKRGFAWATFSMPEAVDALVLTDVVISVGGRQAKVERKGGSARVQWRDMYIRSKWKPPLEIVVKNGKDANSDGWLLAAQFQDGALVFGKEPRMTLKEARELLAQSCLEFVRVQAPEFQQPQQLHSPTTTAATPPQDQGSEPATATSTHTPTATTTTISPTTTTTTTQKQPPIDLPSATAETDAKEAPATTNLSPQEVEPGHSSTTSPISPATPATTTGTSVEDAADRAESTAPPQQSARVRNVSIIAHVDHGKTTLSDSLLSACGHLNATKAGDACALDVGQEAERGITINSTAITLQFPPSALPPPETQSRDSSTSSNCEENHQHQQQLVVNLIDCPGHVDFNSDVTTALRITDGALVVVDAVEGVCVQTELVVRQALNEGVRLVLVLNKVDRLISQMKLTQEDIVQRLETVIANVNALVASFRALHPSAPEHPVLSLAAGNVCFGSGFHGWMACAHTISCVYARAAGSDAEAASQRLDKASRYLRAADDGGSLKASSVDAFCRLALRPVMQVQSLVEQTPRPTTELTRLLAKVGVPVTEDELALSSRALLRCILGRLFPAAQCLLHLVANHLPSPHEAQRVKCPALYTGPLDDALARGIAACDPLAPLVMYVCKMVPLPGSKSSVALGRVLSGTVRAGSTVSVLTYDDDDDDEDAALVTTAEADSMHEAEVPWGRAEPHRFKVSQGRISRVVTVLGHDFSSVSSASAGMVCGVVGLDSVLTTSGTIVASPCPVPPHPITTMRFSVRPIVRVAVRAASGATGASRLLHALDILRRSDPGIRCSVDEETKEHVLSATGELHMEVCINELKRLCAGAQPWFSQARVSHRESVTATSSIECLVKTTNKHNRFWFRASPLGEPLTLELIRAAPALQGKDTVARARHLSEKHAWDNSQARKVLAMGGEFGPNALVDCTSGVQYLSEVKDLLIAAFRSLCASGPLCGERLCGVRVDLVDAKIHHEGAQRRGPQVLPAATRGMSASLLCARPILLQPWARVDVHAPPDDCGVVFSCLSQCQAAVIPALGDGNWRVVAHVPVMNSRSLASSLRETTKGRAMLACCRFAKWSPMHPEESVTRAQSIRQQKGIESSVPEAERLVDRL